MPLTPYAVLSLPPRATDDLIRQRYHDRIRTQHPDMRADKKPGPQWDQLTQAYKLVGTAKARFIWLAGQQLLSGLCKPCKGYGTTAGSGHCLVCNGYGRMVKKCVRFTWCL